VGIAPFFFDFSGNAKRWEFVSEIIFGLEVRNTDLEKTIFYFPILVAPKVLSFSFDIQSLLPTE